MTNRAHPVARELGRREGTLAAAIAKLPRLSFAVRPTPLEPLPRFSAELGGPLIYMKRDDLTGLAFGGNKTRMLEFSLADARSQGAEVIVSGAAVQSNYCRQLAAACAKLGLELHLVLRPEREVDLYQVKGNHFLQRLFGAKVTVLDSNDRDAQQVAIQAKADKLRAQGRRVYRPREAETVDLDAIAYAEVALEIVQQCRAMDLHPTHLYVAAYDTTQAGLVLGLAYLRAAIQVYGVSPFQDEIGRGEPMARLANQAAQRLGLDIIFGAGDFENDTGFVGERYGVPTQAGIDAIQLLATTEGILLDPVYTSKAMSALIAHVRAGKFDKGEPLLFLHTGGSPALFAYVPEVLGIADDS